MAIARLAIANFKTRWPRFALTILAVAVSVALVVSITSGYASIEGAIRNFVADYIGNIDFEITRPDDPRPAIPPDVIEGIANDPRVAHFTSRVEAMVTPIDRAGAPLLQGRMMLFGVEKDEISQRIPRMDKGRYLEPDEHGAIVMDQNALESLESKIDDTITFGTGEQTLKTKIIGVVRKPALLRMLFRSGYVPIDDLRQFIAPDRPGHVNKIRGEFKPGVDSAAFTAEWNAKLRAIDPRYHFQLVRDTRATLDHNLIGLRLASYLGSTIGLAAAAFIILSALMTGVQEQNRQLAMLRAIGATRFQVARLVSIEGVAIGFIGGLLGLPMGIAGIYILRFIFPDFFDGRVQLDPAGMVYAVVVASFTALLASLIPAFLASRAKPLEAMSAATTHVASRLPWKTVLLGILLASLDSIIIFGPFDSLIHKYGSTWAAFHLRDLRLYGHVLVGVPTLLLGALLMGPLVVWLVELIFRVPLAGIFRVPLALLKQQLTESPWRSAATGVAMMIGMMILIVMNAQARSALGAWKLPTRFPDVFIVADASYGKISINPSEVAAIRDLPGVKKDKVMALAVSAPTLGEKVFNVAGATLPDQTLFIGVDPNLAFEMMELDFRAGDEATAKRMMAAGRRIELEDGTIVHGTVESESNAALTVLALNGQTREIEKARIRSNESGRYIIITNEFRKLRGYGIGSTFQLEAGAFIKNTFDFVVVGVVWSPGLDVMLNTFDLPNRVKDQTAATVFGTHKDAKEVFNVHDAFLLAANLEYGVEKKTLVEEMQRRLGREGLTVADVRELKHQIESTFGRVIRFASAVAVMAMLVASIGVGNAIVTAVRTRQWRLGVLRAIGLTRGELLRLLLAEATLLSIVGLFLGTMFGLVLSLNAHQLYAVVIGFDPPSRLPWDVIGWASALVLLTGLLATLAPAISTSNKQPLSLLQSGRSAS